MNDQQGMLVSEADRLRESLRTAFAAVRDDAPLICLDVEASGVGPNTFPVEVGLSDPVSGSIRAWLIRPAPEWAATGTWDVRAEDLHGLSLEQIERDGHPLNQVADQLALAVLGARILSDAPQHDGAWLSTLYRAAGFDRVPLVLDDFQRFSWECAIMTGSPPDLAMASAEFEASARFPIVHRAGVDARHNAEILRQLACPSTRPETRR